MFYVNIITGSGIRTIYICKGLTKNPEITFSQFCPISGDYDKLGILNLAQMSLIKSCWMLKNAKVTAFVVF